MRWFEDFAEGDVFEFGPVTLAEEEIVEFAGRYDPQPFHLDAEAARDSLFGGLVASGWHTVAVFMGMYVREVLKDTASLGSPGVDELRWLAPVRPGDALRGRSTVVETRASSKDPSRGTVLTENEVRNQDGVVVMTLKASGFFRRRPG